MNRVNCDGQATSLVEHETLGAHLVGGRIVYHLCRLVYACAGGAASIAGEELLQPEKDQANRGSASI